MLFRRVTLLVALIGASFGTTSAGLAMETGWQETGPSRVRLIGAGRIDEAMLAGRAHLPTPALLAGVEIRLDDGWKTYWRTPGDGIAPRFDWTGSRNAAAKQVLWPVPRFFRDAAGEYNGYAKHVIFPVVIAPRETDAPVTLELELDYAVCKDICVPVQTTVSAEIGPNAPEDHRERVIAALSGAPLRANRQGRCATGVAINELRGRFDAQPPRLELTLTHPDGAAPVNLFMEAANGVFLTHPKLQSRKKSGRSVYVVDLGETGDAKSFAGQMITVTAVGAQQSCETTMTVK